MKTARQAAAAGQRQGDADAPRVTRRPIKSRDTVWARAVAARLKALGLTPNQVSAMSVVFAALAGAAIVAAARVGGAWGAGLYVSAAAFIQLRLLCNLFDGMLAVEGGLKTRSGEVFNDLPDRFSDAFVLVAAGYSLPWGWGVGLGWAAALLAMGTAYVRVLGGAVGLKQSFVGPMAKQQRMAVVIAGCLASAAASSAGWSGYFVASALAIVASGCIVTALRRTRGIVKELESR